MMNACCEQNFALELLARLFTGKCGFGNHGKRGIAAQCVIERFPPRPIPFWGSGPIFKNSISA